MTLVCLFDLNETLLDMSALDPLFAQTFGEGKVVRSQWFGQLLQSALVSTLLGPYIDFTTLGETALEMTAARHKRTLTAAQKSAILGGMRELPPHPDVLDALARLRQGGARLAALTNSTLEAAQAQVQFAGLSDLFEQVLSADSAQRLKPAPEPYHWAARQMGVPIGETWLIAAHSWDTMGALKAGCRTAFVARPEQPKDPSAPPTDISGANLGAVAVQLLQSPLPGEAAPGVPAKY